MVTNFWIILALVSLSLTVLAWQVVSGLREVEYNIQKLNLELAKMEHRMAPAEVAAQPLKGRHLSKAGRLMMLRRNYRRRK